MGALTALSAQRTLMETRVQEANRAAAQGRVIRGKLVEYEPPRPFCEMAPKSGYNRHHLIEKRLWRESTYLQQRFPRGPDSMPATYVRTGQPHQNFTNAWRREFPYKNHPNHDPNPSQAKLLEKSLGIYKGRPDLLEAILPFL